MPTESELWEKQRATAEAALTFWIAFLDCRMGANNGTPLDANAQSRLLKIVRAVSLVESRHGTQGANQPKRDPLQSGNPNDAWWKELTGQSGNGSRFIRGPNCQPNLWAKEVAAAAEAFPNFDAKAAMSALGNMKKGHTDSGFTPSHSYVWGTVYLVHKINTTAGDPTFACGNLARQRLIDGAVAYNGGGVEDYEQRIEKALKEIGDISSPLVSDRATPPQVPQLITELLEVVAAAGLTRRLTRVAVEVDADGLAKTTSLEFRAPAV